MVARDELPGDSLQMIIFGHLHLWLYDVPRYLPNRSRMWLWGGEVSYSQHF